MKNKAVYIVSAKRTPIGSMLGSLSEIAAHQLGAIVIRSLVPASLPLEVIDEVIVGQVLTGGAGQNPARQTSISAGLPLDIPSFTVSKVCGSGLQAIICGAQSIMCGYSDIIIAGGQENMSLAMHGLYMRKYIKFGGTKIVDLMQNDGLIDAFSGQSMGVTAENIAMRFNISRQEQDLFALSSEQKATLAMKQGIFKEEIVPIKLRKKNEEILFTNDESIRLETTIEALSKLKPVFKSPSEGGSVTAGNSSSINDGASMVMLASEQAVKKYNLIPLARIMSFASAGVDPDIMGTGPVPASLKALDIANLKVADLELIEANEAFAAQAIYVNRQMGWDENIVNVNGGAIALGHAIGSSGARVVVTLIHEMQKRKSKKSLATLCIGGGMGIAICLEGIFS